jgi:hypothetical protein
VDEPVPRHDGDPMRFSQHLVPATGSGPVGQFSANSFNRRHSNGRKMLQWTIGFHRRICSWCPHRLSQRT